MLALVALQSAARSWGQDRLDQVNLPLDGVYNPGDLDGRGVHGGQFQSNHSGLGVPEQSDCEGVCVFTWQQHVSKPSSLHSLTIPGLWVSEAEPAVKSVPLLAVFVLDTGVRPTHVDFTGRIGQGMVFFRGFALVSELVRVHTVVPPNPLVAFLTSLSLEL